MQAIARANRVAEGKNNGLIVDYCGILKNLRDALATFAGSPSGARPPIEDQELLLAELRTALDAVHGFFVDYPVPPFASFVEELSKVSFNRIKLINEYTEQINTNDSTRKQFELTARAVFSKFKAALHVRPQINEYRSERDAVDLLYKKLQKDRDEADISEIMKELQDLVGQFIDHTDSPRTPTRLFDMSKIDFKRLSVEFANRSNKKSMTQDFKAVLESRLEKMLSHNPLRTDLQQRFEEIVEAYNDEKDRVTIEKTFEDLMKFAASLDEESDRAAQEGLDEESLALYDLLRKPELEKDDIGQRKKVAAELLTKLKEVISPLPHWEESESTRDLVKTEIHDFLYSDAYGLPMSYQTEEIDRLSSMVFQHVYRVYPKVPSPVYEEAGC